MGGIRDEVIALDFDGAATIRLVLFDAEIRRKETEALLSGFTKSALAGGTSPASSPTVFQAGDPSLSDFLNPNLPTNRVVMFGGQPN